MLRLRAHRAGVTDTTNYVSVYDPQPFQERNPQSQADVRGLVTAVNSSMVNSTWKSLKMTPRVRERKEFARSRGSAATPHTRSGHVDKPRRGCPSPFCCMGQCTRGVLYIGTRSNAYHYIDQRSAGVCDENEPPLMVYNVHRGLQCGSDSWL